MMMMIINFLDFRSVFVFLLHSSEHWIAAKLFFFVRLLIISSGLSSVSFQRVRVRYQKRQKLQFETKLGMNSPFWSRLVGQYQEPAWCTCCSRQFKPNCTAARRSKSRTTMRAVWHICSSFWDRFLTVDSWQKRQGKERLQRIQFNYKHLNDVRRVCCLNSWKTWRIISEEAPASSSSHLFYIWETFYMGSTPETFR